MSLEIILGQLSKVKKLHKGYKACCPVHQDKSPSMTITETNDGKILIHCFSCGANGKDVVEALGLAPGVLFSGDFTPDPAYRKEKYKDVLLEDHFMIKLYEDSKRNGTFIGHKDYMRYKLAKARTQALA
jgi:hypothetical protein